jgi:hypothetical protein
MYIRGREKLILRAGWITNKLSEIQKKFQSVDEVLRSEYAPYWLNDADEIKKQTKTGMAVNSEEFISGIGKSKEEAIKMNQVAEEDEWDESIESAIDSLVEVKKIKDCDFGNEDGDRVFYIDAKHISKDGWHLDIDGDPDSLTYFRIIKNGNPTRRHGWFQGGEIKQWG